MRILIDLNVLLDVVQQREPHYEASARVLSGVRARVVAGLLPAHGITTVYYIVAKYASRQRAEEVVDWMLEHFELATPHRRDFIQARKMQVTDFEDAVVATLAEREGCDYIVTRNVKDFTEATVSILKPRKWLVFSMLFLEHVYQAIFRLLSILSKHPTRLF